MHKIDKHASSRPAKLHIKKSIFYNVTILWWGYHPRDAGEPSLWSSHSQNAGKVLVHSPLLWRLQIMSIWKVNLQRELSLIERISEKAQTETEK